MISKSFPFFIFCIAAFIFSCGPSPEEIEYQRVWDSTARADSIAQKIITDSIARIDSIRNFSCPELEKFIDLNNRTIALLRSGDEHLTEKFDKMSDSISAMHKELFEKKFTSLDPICRKRLMATDLIFTRDMTNEVIRMSGPAIYSIVHSNSEDAKVDSMAWQMQFGK